ncbi:lambda-exonuclease family protein [Luteimonas sp. MC1825]|uniref:YqaJ viral recombinase family nuclease n=1 Tax=Luteimonas sp. MC1825 TaxID=2761107 RepID=UPI001608C407|nr:YqaJ viral recombinase family protein [Luteimonas sp. MC1825]MBB6600306.1 YqaJ viral recombinase family protein [Luteimonas sp. MC1825]QOC87985.1 YqaJ viral recombinase family protein [Luteimonas sp. MC1825]
MNKSRALRLVDTRALAREEWLEVRKRGIGSSDAAAAVGLCPYKSQLELWMEKTGRAVHDEEPGQDSPMYWGTLLEPFVASAYAERTERKVRRVNAVLQHPTYSFMLANIDREVVGVPDVQILECKTAGEFGSRLWRDGVPEYVQLQVQHQLAVTGKQAADVAVLLCGEKFEVHRIERDEAVISRLIVLEARFWEHVTQDTPPPADGSESSARALRSLYTGNDTSIDFSEDIELSATFDSLVLLREEIAQMDRRAEQMRQQLEWSMGDASRAIFPTGEITYRRSKDGTSVDLKGLTEAHPALAVEFTVARPGSRRFRIVPNQNKGA